MSPHTPTQLDQFYFVPVDMADVDSGRDLTQIRSDLGTTLISLCKKIGNKAITMMRVKSPRSDVEMSKKLNFVAAILDF